MISAPIEEDNASNILDSSFKSFINSTETIGEQEQLQMVFQNKVVKEMVGKISSMDLQTFLDKPIFENQEDHVKVSLVAAASKRYSETFISQPFEVILQAKQSTDLSKSP